MVLSGWILVAATVIVLYTYAGYPLLCFLRARLLPHPIARAAPLGRPSRRVSILVAAHHERAAIAGKLSTLAGQSYPAELTEVVVVCDGSSDGTIGEARAAAARLLPGRCAVLVLPQRRGKPAALNAAVAHASGEILVFTDARQRLAPDAVTELVADFADPAVGAVGGRLLLEGDAPVGAYWRYESAIRSWEGAHGSTIGVSGALYALRRELFAPLPEETILDDVLVPARVRLAGKRVAFEPAAVAYDRGAPSAREFGRKARTLAGNYQLLLLEPALFHPLRNPDFFAFLSHKILRLAVPFVLALAFAASATLPRPYALLFVGAELLLLSLAALSALRWVRGSILSGLAALCETFVVLNAAAVVGLLRFVRDGKNQRW